MNAYTKLLETASSLATVYTLNGRCHRADGPAIVYKSGREEWWLDGKLHRADGPAILYSTGREEWYINGKNITIEVNRWMQMQNVIRPFDIETQAQFILTFIY